MTKEDLDKEVQHCTNQVKKFTYDKEFATGQLEYWERQLEAARTLSCRKMLDGWKKEAKNVKANS